MNRQMQDALSFVKCIPRLLGLASAALAFPVPVVLGAVKQRRLPTRRDFEENCALFCDYAKGAFPKCGQFLSTRGDLFPPHICKSLSRLQEHARPLSENQTNVLLSRLGSLRNRLKINAKPIASASVAQVHYGIRNDDGREVAVKILRPKISNQLRADAQIIQTVARMLALIPSMQSVPVVEAVRQACGNLVKQSDFSSELSNHLRLEKMFGESTDVLVPRAHFDLCGETVIVTDYITGTKSFDDPELSPELVRCALVAGLRSLYKMIFVEGFVHCDMHPGNVLVGETGKVVILDAGFMAELPEKTRTAFAEFFLSIALCDGETAARIVCDTALYVPSNLRAQEFNKDIAALIQRVGGLAASEFQVAGFVASLFDIMRRHGIVGTPDFTLSILALLVYEGVAKARYPDLDFQKEALPFLYQAVSEHSIYAN